ncbi:threonine-phosphate decarboxylase CobD [Enterovirga sp.]|uniref:threonine-phosphate decarboxylase CobD n=1 Tax=Enterovirga sp. TaxID=2026350 RepID=UPI002C8C8DDB|nr:threonine-phosphate decarboxylase CobD [Enterovirga sp.]HMO30181.1 threonine-phosphate decarboxylase CobD [Enterovirga sp.]
MRHGGDLTEAKARYGASGPEWLDLSTGINPHPWPVPDALRRAGWERLPGEAEMRSLLAAARDAYAIPDAAGIVAAPGTQALIQWLPRLAPPGAVAILGPTYAEHAASWRAAGREVVRDMESRVSPTVIHRVVVNPNNPDGRILGPEAIRRRAEDCARAGGWLIVDEAFADLDRAIGASALVPGLPVVVLRSFGKFYGLAGLRLGFAVAPPAVADSLRAALGDWAVSGPALAVGAAALADRGWQAATRRRLAAEAAALDRVLAEGGAALLGGTALFRLVRHPDAAALHGRLAAAHIWCRRFEEAPDLLRFGLPEEPEGLARLREGLARHVQGTSTASPASVAR